MVFFRQSSKTAVPFCKGNHIRIQLRVALVLVVDGQRLRKEALCPSLFGQLPGSHQERICHFRQHLIRCLLQLCRRQVSACFQQLQYPGRCPFPGHHGGAVSGANIVALRQMDAIFHEPDGVFAALILNAAPVLFAEFPAQERDTVRLRALAHIEHRHPVGTVIAVARRI